MENLQFMEFGILSSFLSFLPFLLAAGEPAAMAEELPLMSSVVTEEEWFSLPSAFDCIVDRCGVWGSYQSFFGQTWVYEKMGSSLCLRAEEGKPLLTRTGLIWVWIWLTTKSDYERNYVISTATATAHWGQGPKAFSQCFAHWGQGIFAYLTFRNVSHFETKLFCWYLYFQIVESVKWSC